MRLQFYLARDHATCSRHACLRASSGSCVVITIVGLVRQLQLFVGAKWLLCGNCNALSRVKEHTCNNCNCLRASRGSCAAIAMIPRASSGSRVVVAIVCDHQLALVWKSRCISNVTWLLCGNCNAFSRVKEHMRSNCNCLQASSGSRAAIAMIPRASSGSCVVIPIVCGRHTPAHMNHDWWGARWGEGWVQADHGDHRIGTMAGANLAHIPRTCI